MVDKETARKLAEEEIQNKDLIIIDDKGARELRTGWYFPYKGVKKELMAGSSGVIINKATGVALELGSVFSLERDFKYYDMGYQFYSYDLVIISVEKRDETLDSLMKIELSVVEPEYKHGTVWRVPRKLTRQELDERLNKLPCVFGGIPLYFHIEALEGARSQGAMKFEVFKGPLAG